MKIAVYGQGRLGGPLAQVLAGAGHTVAGVDPKMGWEPVAADVSFVVVPTPSEPDGCFSFGYVENALMDIEKINQVGHLTVVVSTVSPGTVDTLQPIYEDLTLVYNPTFVALGEVIEGLVNPAMLLVGGEEQACQRVRHLWADVFAAYQHRPKSTFVHQGSFVEIELLKLSLNALLGMKISAANSLGQLFEAYGVDPQMVRWLGLDPRIGYWGMTPGGPISGPCLPRDNAALRHAAAAVRVELPLSEATDEVNEAVINRVIADVVDRKPETVGIVGLTYKAGTDVTDAALGQILRDRLPEHDITCLCYDEMIGHDLIEDVLACDVIVVTRRDLLELVPEDERSSKCVCF